MRLAIAIGFVALAGSAVAQPASPSETYTQCVWQNAVGLDDGRSDARTVAAAVHAMCRRERLADLQSRDPLVRPDLMNRVFDQLREADLDSISAVVLRVRRAGLH